MSANVIQGKVLAETIHQRVADRILHHTQLGHRPPGLAVVLVGNDPASLIYVRHKHAACLKVGIVSKYIHLDSTLPEEAFLNILTDLNQDPSIDGILVQLPLPTQFDTQKVIETIRPDKDVDGFHPYNLGRLAQKHPNLRPCTPAGIMELLKSLNLPLEGLDATVIGVSNIVGRPMLLELLMAGCTVTACHKLTRDLKDKVEKADLVVAAAGSPGLIKGHWIKPGAIVIDVGMNRLNTGHLVGDIEFEDASKRAAWITPVPGGVGPMTVAQLLQNTLYAYEALHLKLS